AAQLELADGVAGNDGRQRLIADTQADLREQAVASHFLDVSPQAIAAAQRDDEAAGCLSAPRAGGWRVVSGKAIDFRVGDPVMAAWGVGGADAPFVDPVFQRGVAAAEPFSRRPDGQESHVDSFRIDSNRITARRADRSAS